MATWKKVTDKKKLILTLRSLCCFLPIGGNILNEILSFIAELENEEKLNEIKTALDVLQKSSLAIKAFGHIDLSKYEFNGLNFSSISDNGIGDISLNFTIPIKQPYFVFIYTEDSVIHRIINKNDSSIRIQFFDCLTRAPIYIPFSFLVT